MKKEIFRGSGVAIVTPFNEDLSVNYNKFAQLIEWQIENKTDAIIVCGTTGESATLNAAEHKEVIEFAVKQVAGRIPVVAGTGSNDTFFAAELTKHAKESGADAVLMVTPYYNKATQSGLVKHYEIISNAADIPIIVYNVPSRTGLNILPETYYELSKIPNVVAIKEAGGNIAALAKTAALCKDNLYIYSGNDDEIVPILSLGGIGVISVLANVLPREAHEIVRLYLEGKTAESRDLQLKLLPLCNALFCEVNPIPVKAAMNLLGMQVGGYRPPLFEISQGGNNTLVSAMKELGLI